MGFLHKMLFLWIVSVGFRCSIFKYEKLPIPILRSLGGIRLTVLQAVLAKVRFSFAVYKVFRITRSSSFRLNHTIFRGRRLYIILYKHATDCCFLCFRGKTGRGDFFKNPLPIVSFMKYETVFLRFRSLWRRVRPHPYRALPPLFRR